MASCVAYVRVFIVLFGLEFSVKVFIIYLYEQSYISMIILIVFSAVLFWCWYLKPYTAKLLNKEQHKAREQFLEINPKNQNLEFQVNDMTSGQAFIFSEPCEPCVIIRL